MMRRLLGIVAAAMLCISMQAQQSRIVRDSIYSNALQAQRQFTIYLPKSFDANPTQKYPILYLLHGMYGSDQDWAGRGHLKDVIDPLIASGEACEMIVVSPNAGGGDPKTVWNGYFNMPGWSYEDFFFKEFMPYIESHYRAMGDRQHRAIAGLSMGGGATTQFAQRYSDSFCAAYAMSALMDLPEPNVLSSQNTDDKLAILSRSVTEHSCIAYVVNADEQTKTQLKSVKWFVDCGDDDFLFDRNVEFVQAMHRAAVPCEFRVRDGNHTWEYWHSALYNCLGFVTRAFYGI